MMISDEGREGRSGEILVQYIYVDEDGQVCAFWQSRTTMVLLRFAE